jgi:hypothetical protein
VAYDIYSPKNNAFIPDVVLNKFEDAGKARFVSFAWRGLDQWFKMEIQADGHYLITDTHYTEDFQVWLDENLEDYDSLESMFGSVPKTTKQVYFVVSVEIDADNNATIAIDEDRADALMGEDSVWDTESAEWSPISENEEIFDQATKLLKDKLGS